MQILQLGLLLLAATETLVAPSFSPAGAGPQRGVRSGPQAKTTAYTPSQREYYLSPEQVAYIRPGVNVTILGVTNTGPGQNPVVEVSFTDDLGQPLDRNGAITPGPIDAEFILGQWNPATYDYVNLTTVAFGPGAIYPLHDVGGTWTDVAVGDSKYTFAKTLPANLDVTQTLTLGIYATRSTTDIIGKDYQAPAALLTYRPDGGTPTSVFAAIDTASCDMCHDPISMHGDHGPPIQDVRLCVMCHTQQMPVTQSGEPLTFRVLIHRIHDDKNVDVPGVTYPQDIRHCQTCHTASAADGFIWLTSPSSAACGACHTDVNFVTGAGHPAGPATDDECATCHIPQGDAEWDASVKNAHIVPLESSQLKGLNAQILSVANVGAGLAPVVTFELTNGDGSVVSPAQIAAAGGSLNILLGGPTSDYAMQPFRENAIKATFGGTTAVYSFTNAVPANATGTWTLSIETRRIVTLNPAPSKGPTTVEEGAPNQPFYIAITDSTPQPRRTVVALANCNTCHDRLYILFSHGGQRISIQHCVICHNPNGDDSSQRPAAQAPPESIEFARLIHRIHTGNQLTQNFTIYGFGGSVNTFNDVTFPGDRRDCDKCHNTGTNDLPLASDLLPVVTQRDYFTPRGPATAACTGCHDDKDVAAHAYLNTVFAPFFGEACGTCHAVGADWDVEKVHAR